MAGKSVSASGHVDISSTAKQPMAAPTVWVRNGSTMAHGLT
jgi:hypothetical protein